MGSGAQTADAKNKEGAAIGTAADVAAEGGVSVTNTGMGKGARSFVANLSKEDIDKLLERNQDLEDKLENQDKKISKLLANDAYEDATKFIDKFVAEKFNGSWNTTGEIQELTKYMENTLKDLTPEQKNEFFEYYKNNSEHKVDLVYEMGEKGYFDAQKSILGESAEAAPYVADLLAKRFEIAGNAERMEILHGMTQEQRNLLITKHDLGTTISNLKTTGGGRSGSQISAAEKAEMLALLDGTEVGKDAALLHGFKENPDLVKGILDKYNTPEKMQILQAKMKLLFKVNDLEVFLVRGAATEGAADNVQDFMRDLEMSQKNIKIAETPLKEDPAPAIGSPEPAKPIGPEAESNKGLNYESTGSLHMDKKVLEQHKSPLMGFVRLYEQARASGDQADMENLKSEIEKQNPEVIKAWFKRVKEWDAENKILISKLSPQEQEVVIAQRREFQADMLALLKNPDTFDSKVISVTAKGLGVEEYKKRIEEIEDPRKAKPNYLDTAQG